MASIHNIILIEEAGETSNAGHVFLTMLPDSIADDVIFLSAAYIRK
jgi:hypothetical protein